MKNKFFYIILFTTTVLSGCKGCKNLIAPRPDNQLPPITQTGARTFGAIVNGEVWIPKGWNGGTSNLTISYDPGYAQGTLNVTCYRIIDTVRSHESYLGIGIDSLNNYTIPHTFILKGSGNAGVGYTKYLCEYFSSNPNNISDGFITITKLDKQNGIISGLFAATLYKTDCDTATITDGRFDMKLH